MLQNSFYAISGTFYTLLNNTDLYLSYFILSYVFLGHNDSVEWGLTVFCVVSTYVMKNLKVLWNWKTDSFNWPPCGYCYCWGNFFVDMLKVTQFALHHTQTRRIKKEPTVSPLQLSWHGIIRWKEVFSLKKCIDTLLFKLYCTAQFQLLASIERRLDS